MVTGAINLIPEESTARMVELALLAESLGYARCWVYDEGLASRDVHVVMTAIAVATTKIAIGPGITNPYTRHPAATASAIASLDEVSGGRAFYGIGAGGSLTLDPMALKRKRPLGAVRDSIAIARGLFLSERVDHKGAVFSVENASIAYGRAGTEIWLAGRGPKMLALGGAQCDGVMLDCIYKPHLQDVVTSIRDAGRAHANTPKISYSTMVLTSDRALAVAKAHMTYRLVDSPPEIKALIGITDAECDKIRAAMADGLDAAGEFVRDEWVMPFVISGSVEECAGELERISAECGIDEFLLPVLDDENAEEMITTVSQVLDLNEVAR